MPRYSVVWAADVQDDFIEQWLIADSARRQLLSDLANLLDRELAVAPEMRGRSLPSAPALRVWSVHKFSPMASVVFEVLPDDRIVRVLRIALTAQ